MSLNTLLEYPTASLGTLLKDAGSSEPLESKICKGTSIPKIFPLEQKEYADSYDTIYDLKIQEQLHSRLNLDENSRKRPVSTYILNNPVPKTFS